MSYIPVRERRLTSSARALQLVEDREAGLASTDSEKVEEFKIWLNDNRMADVSSVFHQIVCKVRRMLAPEGRLAGPRAYISGPMSNYPDLNRDAFNAEAARLLALGYQVENPADVVLPDGATWADFMRADIPRLLACTHIHMLDGWTMSRGARLEHHIAISLGLEVLTDCDLKETK